MHGPTSGPGGGSAPRQFAGPGPGCGLGAACARGERRAELVLPVGPKKGKESRSVFSFPVIANFWKMKNISKKI